MTKERPSEGKISQFNFRPLLWQDRGEVVFWTSSWPELIPSEKGWQKVNLSSIVSFPRWLKSIRTGELPPRLSPESVLRMMTGSALHQLYTLGLFLTFNGEEEMLPYSFPTTKRDSSDWQWVTGTVSEVLPVFKDDQEKGLEVLWQETFAHTEREMREQWPLWIRPEDGINFDEVFNLWQKSDAFQRGYQLINYLTNLDGVLPYDAERMADIYYEAGVVCFLHDLRWVLITRLDELVSGRKKGDKRKAFVVDFKSGQKPPQVTEADFVYHVLMELIAERMTTKYLVRGEKGRAIPAEGKYLKLTVKNFLSKASLGRAEAVIRYLEGPPIYKPATLKDRERALKILRGWKKEMEHLGITSI